MKIKITKFAARQFDKKFGATKILDYTPEQFEKKLSELKIGKDGEKLIYFTEDGFPKVSIDGYAPFCKLLPIKNFTDARVGSLPITLENYQYIRSGYSARQDEELPVFSRWLELPIGKPKADYLMLILYSREQIEKEWIGKLEEKIKLYEKKNNVSLSEENKKSLMETEEFKYEFENVDFDYGVVAILGQSHDKEESMKPETMLRNSGYGISKESLDNVTNKIIVLIKEIVESNAEMDDDKIKCDLMNLILNSQGIAEGGSGVPLDKEKYLASVEFWSNNCTVK